MDLTGLLRSRGTWDSESSAVRLRSMRCCRLPSVLESREETCAAQRRAVSKGSAAASGSAAIMRRSELSTAEQPKLFRRL